jgi:DNA-binding NtrC family response regulator
MADARAGRRNAARGSPPKCFIAGARNADPHANGMNTVTAGKSGAAGGKARVALVTKTQGSTLAVALTREGHDLVEGASWQDVADAGPEPFDLVLCDVGVTTNTPTTDSPVMFFGDDATGATPSVSPAIIESSLDAILSLAVALHESTRRCSELESLAQGMHTGSAIVGATPVVRRLQSTISRAADCDMTVLVNGPAGAGKSLAARMIHAKSRRGAKPLVALQASPSTSADDLARTIEAARGSTLLIEDIEKLPAGCQAQLVKHLKERSGPAGAAAPRLVATTTAHLNELVPRGAFREDLHHRLHGLSITVPGLHERLDDLALLVQDALARATGGKAGHVTADAIAHLTTMSWPGNVTQLQATVQRAALRANGAAIGREHLTAPVAHAADPVAPRATEAADRELTEADILPFEQEEKRLLARALRATKGQVRRAAQLLGIGRATLYRKIQQYHLPLR